MNNIKDLDQFAVYMSSRVSPATLRIYLAALKQFSAGMDGHVLTPELAQDYLDSLTKSGKSPSTVGLRAHAIMGYFKYKKMDVHLDCPSVKVKKPEYLKPPEVGKVIRACRTQLERTVVVMLYDTAVRISELLSLITDNIDWQAKTINVVRKGGRETEVNVSDKALKELRKWLSARRSTSKRVFLDLDYYTIWGVIKKIGERAGFSNIHPHIFRHSRAINMLKSGAKPYVVQQHLAHASITTTMNIYGMFMASDLREDIPEWNYE